MLTFVHNVFDMPILGVFRTLHVMLFLLAVALGSATRTLQLLRAAAAAAAAAPAAQFAPQFEATLLSRRWRAERNIWLAAFALTLWAALAAFWREASRRLALEDRLAGLEAPSGEYTATADEPSAREPAASREVSSRPAAGLTPRSAASPGKAARPPAPPRGVEPPPPPAGRFEKKDA